MIDIYLIKKEDKVLYVGKTNDFERRKKEHTSLCTNTSDWLGEIGINNVTFEIIKSFPDGDTDNALKCEDEMILKYDTIENGYNINRSGLIRRDNIGYWSKVNSTEERKVYNREKIDAYYATPEGKKHKADYFRERYNSDPVFRAKEQERKRLAREKKKLEKLSATQVSLA